MALHEQSVGATDEWYTPRYIFDALGCRFDVDVAASPNAAWVPADDFIFSGSLDLPWRGFVWMNPPFGARNTLELWLDKFVCHGNGIALTPDRTSAPWWQRNAVWMDLILFVSPKIKFIDKLGNPGTSPAQGTTLMGMGPQAIIALTKAQEAGIGILAWPKTNRLYWNKPTHE